MPSGQHKSGRYRKIFVKTPGSRVVIHYRKYKPSKPKCAKCSKQLAGVPRGFHSETSNLPKSQKRPERPYGGNLCSACTRLLLKSKARDSQ